MPPPPAVWGTIDLTESLASTRNAGRIRNLYWRLESHVKVPAVRDFLERARGLIQ